MKVGDLVKNIYTGEVFIVTNSHPQVVAEGSDDNYVEVDSQWFVPKEHLEVLNASR